MDFEKMTSVLLRTFVGGAFFFLFLAIALKALGPMIADLFPQTEPIQVLNWAVVLLAFSTVLLLRQIREGLRELKPVNS